MRRTQYTTIKAFTSYVSPASVGIANFGEPEDLFDRKPGTTATVTIAAINAAAPATGTPPSVDLTWTSHGLLNGQQIIVYGFVDGSISDDINDLWYVTRVDANTLRLMGCEATGVTGASAQAATGGEDWGSTPLNRLYDFSGQFPNNANNGQLSSYYWNGDVFRFAPATVDRQLKIVYDLSGTAPTFGSVGIDDSLDALATMTAALAFSSKGAPTKAAQMFVRAVGNPAGDMTNITGGHFYELVQLAVRETQKVRIVMPRYRRKRNVGPAIYGW